MGADLGIGRPRRASAEAARVAVDGNLASGHDRTKRPPEDPHVHRERAPRSVEAVHVDLLRQDAGHVVADSIAGIEDLALPRERELGEPGDARPDRENRVVRLPMLLDEAWIFGARSDKAHLALENVPELRQLVELRPGEKRAQTREALVLRLDERGPARPVVHLSKLQHPQLTAPAPNAAAPI